MPIMRNKNIDIYYELHGQGAPLVLIAGYTCDHLVWQMMLPQLKQQAQVLIFDNRAVGQTKDTNLPITLEEMADDTILLAEALHLKQPTILGHSMGGSIAQIIAGKYPQQINKLILLNTSTVINKRAITALEGLLMLRQANVALDCLINTVLPWLFSSHFLAHPNNISGFKEYLLGNPHLQTLGNQIRQFNALSTFNSRSWLSKITAPTLVIAAEEDILALVSESQELAKCIANADLATIPGGHSSPLEQPNAVNQLVMDFIQQRST